MKTPSEEKRFRFNLVTLTWENTPVGRRPHCCNRTTCIGNYCHILPGGIGAELPPGASKQPLKQLDEQARAQGYSHFGEAVAYAHQQRRDNHALDSMIYSVAASPFYLGKLMGFHAFCDPTLGVPFEWKKPNFIFVDEVDIPTEASDLADLKRLELEANTTRTKIRAIHDRRKARALEARRQERINNDALFRRLLGDVTYQIHRKLLLDGEVLLQVGDDCYVIHKDDDGRPSPALQEFISHLLNDIEGQFIHKWERQYPKDDLLIYEVVGVDVQGDAVTYTGPLRFTMSPTGV